MPATLSPDDNTALVLKELDIPGRTGPVSMTPTIWGINLAAARDNFPRQGLLCRAGPWGTMDVGDKLVVFWGTGQQVHQETVDKDQVGQVLTMFVPAARISDGAFKVSYAVTRFGQVPEPSEVMEVLVKLTRPGGHDDNDQPGHSKLIMSIPKEILDGGIDKDNVAAGVPITILPYPLAAAGDVIQVTWGGVFVLSEPLTQDQADGKVPIIVHVDEATIREADDSDDAGLAVAFEVYDEVDNRSEDWSREQRVVVAIDATRLMAPLLKEAVNNVLDVDKLGDANGTAQILAVDASKFKVGDTIIVRIKGTPQEGAPIDLEITGQPLISVPSIVEIPLPNAALRQLAKTQFALSYRLQKADGSDDLLAKAQFITVIGEIQRLLAPVALDAQHGALDPQLAQVRIEIPFDASFAAGQAIKLFWLGTRPDLTPYLPDLGLHPITNGDMEAKEPLRINVDGAHLTPVKGGTVELYYQLLIDDAVLGAMTRVNATHSIRESLHLAPLNVGEPRQELPEPEVQGVVDGVLPADRLGTTLTVTYLNTVKDDEVFYEWIGSKTGKASDSVKLSSFTAGQPVPFLIKAELIKGNEGGTVSASYFIKRADGRTSYANPLEFRVAEELDLTPPSVKEAPNGVSLDPFAAKDHLTIVVQYTGMLATDKISVTWAGTAGAGSHTSTPVDVETVGSKEIEISNTVVAFNLGKPVKVSYTVIRGGVSTPSDSLLLNVLAIADEDTRLKTPKITQAANNGEGPELHVSSLTSGATVRCETWALIARSQPVWLYLRGKNASGGDHSKTLMSYPGNAVHPDWLEKGYYDLQVPYEYLKDLADGSSLEVVFKVSLNKDANDSTAVTFPQRIYTVKALVDEKPTLTSIKGSPSNVEIPPGGSTNETSVVLTGTAYKGQKVDILDGTTSKGQPIADPSTGIWILIVTGLSVAAHSITAKAQYGSGKDSEPRTFRVVPALIMPTTPINLSGFNLSIDGTGFDWPIKADLAGTVAQREANGGIPPIRYKSSDTQIATVDESNGTVRSIKNGTATITAIDSINQERSYVVNCSNVYRITINPTPLKPPQVAQWVSSINGRIITMGDKVLIETALQAKYAISGPNKWGWTGEAIAGGATIISFHIPNAFYVKIYQGTASPTPALGVCLVS